jgi:phage shock protein C
MANLFTREDTFLGICEGIGQDFRVPPVLIRLGFAGALFWNWKVAVTVYLLLGVAVLVSRLAFPDRRAAAPVPASAEPVNDAEPIVLAEAA